MRIIISIVLLVIVCATLISMSAAFKPFFRQSMKGSSVSRMHMMTQDKPTIKKMDEDSNIAVLEITLTGLQTQAAYDKSCELFNEEVKTRGYKVPGFRPGAKLPVPYLYQMFGEANVKGLCSSLLGNDIQVQADKTGLTLVGRGRIIDFKIDDFQAGKPHTVDIEVDLWPKIGYGSGGSAGYKGIEVTLTRGQVDMEKMNKVKDSVRERYKILTPTPMGYAAKLGDVVVANMNGFECAPGGLKGLPKLFIYHFSFCT